MGGIIAVIITPQSAQKSKLNGCIECLAVCNLVTERKSILASSSLILRMLFLKKKLRVSRDLTPPSSYQFEEGEGGAAVQGTVCPAYDDHAMDFISGIH